eukprot:TRINITY_DN23542_c0_g1_i1.p1 TRINITY_DN23542_c0_g1~~TRINITY_DN23542_c0_g1_i1.p1  ORF type:complete len:665 (-),score=140.01 TRINITY_DN23542_c0_g1_i1:897-2891(-)
MVRVTGASVDKGEGDVADKIVRQEAASSVEEGVREAVEEGKPGVAVEGSGEGGSGRGGVAKAAVVGSSGLEKTAYSASPEVEETFAEIIRIRDRLTSASDWVSEPNVAEVAALGSALGVVVERLRLTPGFFMRKGGARPNWFVGVRMPPSIRQRLERTQARFCKFEPDLKKAKVQMEKSHITLLVTRVETGQASAACIALTAAAKAWRNAMGSEPLLFHIRGVGAFTKNGVLFAEMGPAELVRKLRGFVVEEFARAGFAIMDEKDIEPSDGLKTGARDRAESADFEDGQATRMMDASSSDDECEAESVMERVGQKGVVGVEEGEKEIEVMKDKEGNKEEKERAEGEAEKNEGHRVDALVDERHVETRPNATARQKKTIASTGPSAGSGAVPPGVFMPHITLFKSSAAGRGRQGPARKSAQAAKKAILRSSRAMSEQARTTIDFGKGVLGAIELVNMLITQEDGYYGVQAQEALCNLKEPSDIVSGEVSKETSAGCECFDETFVDARFDESLDNLLKDASPSKKEKRPELTNVKAKSAEKVVEVAHDEMPGREADDNEIGWGEADMRKPKTKKLRKGGDGHGEVTKHERQALELAVVAEKRVDPADGEAYTLEELVEFYDGTYGRAEVDAYWQTECEVVPSAQRKAAVKAKAKAKVKARVWRGRG